MNFIYVAIRAFHCPINPAATTGSSCACSSGQSRFEKLVSANQKPFRPDSRATVSRCPRYDDESGYSRVGIPKNRALCDNFLKLCMVLAIMVVFENVMSIPNTMQSFKKLSQSARFLQNLVYSLSAII